MSSAHESARQPGDAIVSPYDTVASSGLRFLIEVLAWAAGPWAAAELTGSGWAIIPTLVVLVGLPAVFSTPGDKNSIVVATPGIPRILIEMLLLVVAVASAWIVWPIWVAMGVTLVGMGMVVTGLPRYRWLAAGAPPVPVAEPGDGAVTAEP